ncbi:MAG: RHS repeat-associated core domain-containing protein, partial [Sedimentisphaerales bacterium]|nr:RHS repeat-associated core domain-containing protein [Sedimentisphaerales bacterium]
MNSNPYLAKASDGLSFIGTEFFGKGRLPLSALGLCLMMGAGFGFAESRRRLARYMWYVGPVHKFFYSKNPFKQMLVMAVLASVVLGSMPQDVYADTPAYDPVFYYYHSDHLGSSSVMTDRNGTLVQQYGYTAFGKERYKNNTSAFNVTSRYTGQKLDDETGLYFYNARYYDPELARFIQSDTVVPSADTSQALNRYAYVKNNPLKFTDPSGHGWFSKFMKKWVGTILTVALILIAPWGTGMWAMMAYGMIGSAVSTAVNGGNFKSFAIGMAIGAAAGAIGSGIGQGLLGEAAWKAMGQNIIGAAIQGAIIGAISGAISSAVYGGDVWKNVGEGALAGGIAGAAVGAAKQIRASWDAKTAAKEFFAKLKLATATDMAGGSSFVPHTYSGGMYGDAYLIFDKNGGPGICAGTREMGHVDVAVDNSDGGVTVAAARYNDFDPLINQPDLEREYGAKIVVRLPNHVLA